MSLLLACSEISVSSFTNFRNCRGKIDFLLWMQMGRECCYCCQIGML